MNKPKISPLPWSIDESEHHYGKKITRGHWIRSVSGSVCDLYSMHHGEHNEHIGIIPFPESEANAQFIVRAVNSHEALVEALEKCVEACRDNLSMYAYKNEPLLLAAYQQAKAALALAKGTDQ